MSNIQIVKSNIIANVPSKTTNNIYSENILKSITVNPGTKIFASIMDFECKLRAKIKVGIITNHYYSDDEKTNILEIDTNWNLNTLQKYTVLTPLGSGHVKYNYEVVDYIFKEFYFGSFYNIEDISNYIGRRKEFDMSTYLKSNRFIDE